MNKKIEEAEISYPIKWQYKLIGTDFEQMKQTVADIVSEKKYYLQQSNTSKQGKYISISVFIMVDSEQERNTYFSKFSQSSTVRMVL